MTNIQLILLSLLQGVTEFLPVSSSGHLILFSKLTNFPDQGIYIDVALHIGSIMAVILYFCRDLWKILVGLIKGKIMPNFKFYGNKLFYLLIIATIPAIIMGIVAKYYGLDKLRNIKLIGWNILIYGIILWIIDNYSITIEKIKDLTIKDALIIGIAQSLALLPGTSRSGITITAGRYLGLERREAAKFSLLLAIPTILASGLLLGYEMYQQGDMSKILEATKAIEYSFLFSIGAIFILMQWLKKWSFLPFVLYRIALGIYILLDAYGIYDMASLFK